MSETSEPRAIPSVYGFQRSTFTAPKPKRQFSWQPIAAFLFLVAMAACSLLWVSNPQRWAVGSALFVVPILTLLTFPLFSRANRRGASFDIGGLMAVGLFLRILGALYRYDSRADAGVYHLVGVDLARSFRSLAFDVNVDAPIPGTGGMRYLAGISEVIANNNEFASFLIFTWLGFLGCFFLYRAFETALPDGDRRRYALLIFLWPSLLYWPSSIGKDCWMMFTIGLASYGAARVLTRLRGGYTLLAVGLLGGSLVRPHIAVIAIVAFGLALLIGRQTSSRSSTTPAGIARVAGLIVLLALGAVLASRFGDFLEANDITSVGSGVTVSADRSAQGDSQFAPADPQNPLGYAEAAVTIFLRPSPFEASSAEQFLSSFEAMFLAGLAVVSWRRLASIPFRLRREPYVAYALFSVLMLIFALGTISNFGILARQRSQVFPLAFVLLCVTVPQRVKDIRGTAVRSTRLR